MTRYFTRHLVNEKGSSPQTVDSYRHAFLLYFEYMESRCGIRPEKLTVSDYTRASILDFLEWLEEERHNNPATRNYRLAAMKGFVHYLKADGVELLVSQIDRDRSNGLRDYVIILLLYTTGIRVSELTGIKVKDISLTEPYTIKIHGNGNKGRYVPLVKTAIPHIQKHLVSMGYDTEARYDEFLFKTVWEADLPGRGSITY